MGDMVGNQNRKESLYIVSVIIVGTLFRLIQYLSNRSLWLDEALLSTNICTKDFAQLTGTLDYNQGAPLLYLWLVKACTLVRGNNEYALRLVSLAAALAVLPLTYMVARRYFCYCTAIFSLIVVAVSPSFVYYSAEVKQYELDAAVSLLILLVAGAFANDPRSICRAALLAGVGAISPWASHPAIFTLAASGAWLILATSWRGDRRVALLVVLVGAAWVVSFAADYYLILRPLSRNALLQQYWEYAFIAVPPRNLGDIRQYLSVLVNVFEFLFGTLAPSDATGVRVAMLALMLWVAGMITIWRTDRAKLALFALPFGLVMICAMLKKYPARDRLILFSLPMFAISLSRGVSRLIEASDREVRVIGGCLFIGLVLLPTVYDLHSLAKPPAREEVRPVLEEVARLSEPGDILCVYWETFQTHRFYQRCSPIASLPERVIEAKYSGNVAENREMLSRLRGHRAWLVLSHLHGQEEENEGAMLVALFQERGILKEKIRREGAIAFLFLFPDKDM